VFPLLRYNSNLQIYPESAAAWDSLGEALDSTGNMEEALASYRKAVSLAEAKGDPNVESYRKHVARLAGAPKPDGK
jgi:cytochrome c-type biogenesis protein CcmH/NrfG